MLKDKKCIDFHAHPVTDSFRKAMVDLGIDPIEEDGFPLPKWSAEEHLAFMEEAGIDYSVLSAPVPHIYNGDAPKARKAAREINDGVAETVRRRSDRFGFVGLVPLLGLILLGFQMVYTSGYNSGYLDACVDAKKGVEPMYVLIETES
ncbi:MAG: hypothetical protein IIU43_11485, partial [Thermoguttaceae bacterium]|nr:hypothetical protein [Thermoguttaceae bacterium]